jgi:uncharacterized protein YndB with AHSA1/START domain
MSAPSDALPFQVERTLRAPLARVWAAWTEPALFAQWWGPRGVPLGVVDFDMRAGGRVLYTMTHANGAVWWGRWAIDAVEPQARIAWRNAFSTPEGGLSRAPFLDSFPLEVENEVLFTPLADGGTHLLLRGQPRDPTAAELETYLGMFAGMRMGFGGTLDQLEAALAAG